MATKKSDLKKMAKRSRKVSRKKGILDKSWKELKRDFDKDCAQMDLNEKVNQQVDAIELLERGNV
jgi:hypothetical protein